MMDTPNVENLTHFFRNLGAEEKAARVMAGQLLKRADQLVRERSITQLEAVEYLLQVTIAGRDGRIYEGPMPGNRTTKRDERPKKG